MSAAVKKQGWIRRLVGYMKPHKKNAYIAFGVAIGGQLIQSVLPLVQAVIIDDVITDGASKRESVNIIRAAGAQPVAVLIALDRMERSGTEGNLSMNSAVEEFTRDQGLPVHSIASLSDLLQYVDSGADPALSMHRGAVVAYRQRYGV